MQGSLRLVPNHLATGLAPATAGLNKTTLPHTKSPKCQRQTVLQETGPYPRQMGARHGAQQQARLRANGVPSVHQLPCDGSLAEGAETHGPEKYGALPGLPQSRGNSCCINAACSQSQKSQGPSCYPELRFIRQEAGEHEHMGLSNWIPLDLYSIWDDNEVVNTEIQDSNKALTFIDLGVNLNHHLATRRWVIYSSPSCPRSSCGSLGEQQHKGACECRGR